MSDPVIELQVKMIEAGDKGDFAAVNQLLADDKYLLSFGNYLHSMMRNGTGAIEKSLNLSNLDRASAPFERVVSNMVVQAAHKGDADLLELMLKHSRKPAEDSSDALRSLFNRLAERAGDESPATEIGKILLRNGAQVDEALAQPRERLSGREAELRRLKEQVEDFKSRLSPARDEPATEIEIPAATPALPEEKPAKWKQLLQRFKIGPK
jgi:hypothetical protein